MSLATKLVALPFAVALSTLAACAAETSPAPDEDAVAATDEALTAAASKLAGVWVQAQGGAGPLAHLSLRADGTYGATVRDGDFLAESGTWSATRRGGTTRLRLAPAGAPVRVYQASKSGAALTLRRAGVVQALSAGTDDQCFDDADCGIGAVCGVNYCLMACLPGDPLCCGPRTCRSTTPPQPPAGEPCGSVTCGEGTTCCNPLAGICTPPGFACIQ